MKNFNVSFNIFHVFVNIVIYDHHEEGRFTVIPDSSMSSTNEIEIYEDQEIGSTSSEPRNSYGRILFSPAMQYLTNFKIQMHNKSFLFHLYIIPFYTNAILSCSLCSFAFALLSIIFYVHTNASALH